jgi:hypothetical protein
MSDKIDSERDRSGAVPEPQSGIKCIGCENLISLDAEFPISGEGSFECGSCGTKIPYDSNGHQSREDLEKHIEKLHSLKIVEKEHDVTGMWWILREVLPILTGTAFSVPLFVTFFFNGSSDPTFTIAIGTVLTLVGYFAGFFFVRDLVDRFLFDRFISNHPDVGAVTYDFYKEYDVDLD